MRKSLRCSAKLEKKSTKHFVYIDCTEDFLYVFICKYIHNVTNKKIVKKKWKKKLFKYLFPFLKDFFLLDLFARLSRDFNAKHSLFLCKA